MPTDAKHKLGKILNTLCPISYNMVRYAPGLLAWLASSGRGLFVLPDRAALRLYSGVNDSACAMGQAVLKIVFRNFPSSNSPFSRSGKSADSTRTSPLDMRRAI